MLKYAYNLNVPTEIEVRNVLTHAGHRVLNAYSLLETEYRFQINVFKNLKSAYL